MTIKQRAKANGLTLGELAARMGLDQSTLARWNKQRGRIKTYRLDAVNAAIRRYREEIAASEAESDEATR